MTKKYRAMTWSTFEAVQWKGRNIEEIENFVGRDFCEWIPGSIDSCESVFYIYIDGIRVRINVDEWITKSQDGSLSFCPSTLFAERYKECK